MAKNTFASVKFSQKNWIQYYKIQFTFNTQLLYFMRVCIIIIKSDNNSYLIEVSKDMYKQIVKYDSKEANCLTV